MAEKEYNIREFELEKIPLSCSFIVIGAPKSGKGTFMENLMYFNKHRVPVARTFTGAGTQFERFKKITHPLYASYGYKEEEEKMAILRQKQCALEGNHNNSINIVDDAGDDPRVFKGKTFLGLFKIGTQHWDQIFIVANQYAIDFLPPIRKAVSYVVLFREVNPIELKKLYDNFGGICGSYEVFEKFMLQLTGDYTCMIIKKDSQTNDLEECIFWYRTVPLDTNWKFGCSEYREWAEKRYNKTYKEKATM